MTETSMRRGDRVWRVGKRYPLKCHFVRSLPDSKLVELRISTFAEAHFVPSEDVFTDRDKCREEIDRRIERAMR